VGFGHRKAAARAMDDDAVVFAELNAALEKLWLEKVR
jgi:hypothetical protein